jgi:hypothetical protein
MPNTTPLLFPSSMSSIKALEITCNANEINLDSKLTSLDAVTVAGAKGTEAIFETVDDDSNLGKLTIKKDKGKDEPTAVFKGKTFILTVQTNVLVFRG